MIKIEEEIRSDLLRDKVKRIYNNYRLYIIFFILILILGPVLFQINSVYLEKKNQKFLEKHSNAILLINMGKDSDGIKILNELKGNSNLFTQVLTANTLVDYYLTKNDKAQAIEEINYALNVLKKKNDLLNEILAIKKTLLIFDKVSEEEILELLKPNNANKIFKSVSNKILYDYYLQKKQYDKAKIFLKN